MKIDANDLNALKEYYAELHRIHDENAPERAILLPSTETIYSIDLVSRKIEKPADFAIVEEDHASETIYFKVPRYFDNVDLFGTVCIIEYINAKKESHIYAVPYYDIDHCSVQDPDNNIDEPMMLIPWRIAGSAAAKPGEVTFAFRFYAMDASGTQLLYNLNTIPQTLTILPGIGFDFKQAASANEEEVTSEISHDYDKYFSDAAKAAAEGSLTWIVVR